ncbi:MAG: ATP-binding cassette domain-containing protein [Planctomycetota bacterium]
MPGASLEQPEHGREGDVVVSFREVDKSFGDLTVFDGFSLDIERERTTVVLGPSGSGKSVMLKHIIGLLRPDAGEVWFAGTRVDQLREHEMRSIRRRVGFLFQLSALFDSMTVGQNLEFPLREHTDLSKKERADRVSRMLELVDLAGIESRMPAKLSGGQQKRVALARAVILEPEVILYDEPTTGLDPSRADGINDLIVKLQQELSVTSIVVTHDLLSAERVADRAVLLFHGKVIADGT